MKRSDVYYAELDPVLGSEQKGTRPVLIIQNNLAITPARPPSSRPSPADSSTFRLRTWNSSTMGFTRNQSRCWSRSVPSTNAAYVWSLNMLWRLTELRVLTLEEYERIRVLTSQHYQPTLCSVL
jgi:hypothetical protein